jgi:S1-C subfamily serine protease
VRAKEFLSQRGVPFAEKRVDEDWSLAQEMVRVSGQQGVPVIVVDGQVVVGFDRPRLEQLLASASAGRAGPSRPAGGGISFGASIADAASFLHKQGRIPIFGAYVGRVSPGSPAARAGLQAGDIITELNIRPVARAEDVAAALAGLRSGDRVVVVYTRGERSYRAETAV